MIINAQFIQIHTMFDVELYNSICPLPVYNSLLSYLWYSYSPHKFFMKFLFEMFLFEMPWMIFSFYSFVATYEAGARWIVNTLLWRGKKLIYFLHYEWKMGNCENVDEQSKTQFHSHCLHLVGLHTPHSPSKRWWFDENIFLIEQSHGRQEGDDLFIFFVVNLMETMAFLLFFFVFHCHQTHNAYLLRTI